MCLQPDKPIISWKYHKSNMHLIYLTYQTLKLSLKRKWKSLSHVRLCHSVDYSPPGYSVHGILQARILERITILFSRGSSPPRDRTWVSRTAGGFFTIWATRETTSTVFRTRIFPAVGQNHLTQSPFYNTVLTFSWNLLNTVLKVKQRGCVGPEQLAYVGVHPVLSADGECQLLPGATRED